MTSNELWTPKGLHTGMDRAEQSAQQELDAVTHRLARHISDASKSADGIPDFFQGTVSATNPTTTSYTVSVTMADGTIIDGVNCLNCTPIVNDGVWIVNVGRGRWLCLGSAGIQQPRVPHTSAKRRNLVNGMVWTNQTAFAVLPNATERTALTLAFTKHRTDTKLVINLEATLYAATVLTWTQIGLSPDAGSTIWGYAIFFFNATGTHQTASANFEVAAGFAAGSYSIEPVIRFGANPSQFQADVNDNWSFSVTETL